MPVSICPILLEWIWCDLENKVNCLSLLAAIHLIVHLCFAVACLQCTIPTLASKTVPKSLYQFSTEEIEQGQERSSDDPNLFGKSAYQTAYVAKDFPHEVSQHSCHMMSCAPARESCRIVNDHTTCIRTGQLKLQYFHFSMQRIEFCSVNL